MLEVSLDLNAVALKSILQIVTALRESLRWRCLLFYYATFGADSFSIAEEAIIGIDIFSNFLFVEACVLICSCLFAFSAVALAQGFPTFFLPCTPSAFRQTSMYL